MRHDRKRSELPHDSQWRQSAWRSRLRKRLLVWFHENKRDLPWRVCRDPYRIWISEVMLQQTQVATVIPYYERFIKRFPTVAALASADEQSLLSCWEGLGYYRRARSLHAAAKQICEQHNGQFPTMFQQVIALPGIGRYTAGAILSISQNQRLPILEGNTQRVFSRWVSLRGSVTEKPTLDLLWQISEAFLPPTPVASKDQNNVHSAGYSAQEPHPPGPGTFNQAAMELGATVCTPRDPDCQSCPVKGMCRARINGLQHEIPGKVKKIQYESRTEFAFVIEDTDQPRFLIRMTPEGQRWAGLWDFPRVTSGEFENVIEAARSLELEIPGSVAPTSLLATIKHAVTKYRIELQVHRATISKRHQSPSSHPYEPAEPWRFATLRELKALPMSVTGRKIANKLEAKRKEAGGHPGTSFFV